MAEIAVADSGIGIAPEDQEHVFEEFRQVGSAEKRADLAEEPAGPRLDVHVHGASAPRRQLTLGEGHPERTMSPRPDAAAKPAHEFLAEMIRFKAYSGTPGEGELARSIVERMRRWARGLRSGRGTRRLNAIGIWRGTGGGRSLLFNGHLDSNPVTEGWTLDPWGGVSNDRFIYGIGVSNMNVGDAASFCLVERLMERCRRLRGDVVLIYVVSELQGGIGTLKASRQRHPRRLHLRHPSSPPRDGRRLRVHHIRRAASPGLWQNSRGDMEWVVDAS